MRMRLYTAPDESELRAHWVCGHATDRRRSRRGSHLRDETAIHKSEGLAEFWFEQNNAGQVSVVLGAGILWVKANKLCSHGVRHRHGHDSKIALFVFDGQHLPNWLMHTSGRELFKCLLHQRRQIFVFEKARDILF